MPPRNTLLILLALTLAALIMAGCASNPLATPIQHQTLTQATTQAAASALTIATPVAAAVAGTWNPLLGTLISALGTGAIAWLHGYGQGSKSASKPQPAAIAGTIAPPPLDKSAAA